ncbi:MAG: sensor histidine kinase [Christensenellales bacterium]|jgi:signal transduction histidine kinase
MNNSLRGKTSAKVIAFFMTIVFGLLSIFSLVGVVFTSQISARNPGGDYADTSYHNQRLGDILQSAVTMVTQYNYWDLEDGARMFEIIQSELNSLAGLDYTVLYLDSNILLQKEKRNQSDPVVYSFSALPYDPNVMTNTEGVIEVYSEETSDGTSFYHTLHYNPYNLTGEIEFSLSVDRAMLGHSSGYQIYQWFRLNYNFVWMLFIVSALLCACAFVFALCAAGHKNGAEGIVVTGLDRVYLEFLLLGALLLILIPASFLVRFSFTNMYWYSSVYYQVAIVGCVGIIGAICYAVFLSLVRRGKAHIFWTQTFCYKLYRWTVDGFARIAATYKIILVLLVYWLATFLSIVTLASSRSPLVFLVGIIVFVFVQLAALALVALVGVQVKQLAEDSQKIASGNLSHHSRTDKLFFDFRKIAENLNNIGDGMQTAVEQRLRSERFKSELITNVSHDIKTPLTSIINYVDLLKKADLPDETIREYVEVLDRKSQRLKKLTVDLVEASRASTGNVQVNLAALNPQELIEQSIAEYEQRLKERRLTVVTRLPEETLQVMADSQHLWRVIDNLFANVCNYAMEGTRVYVDLLRRDTTAVIRVRNVSAEALNITADELMERFVRGDYARTTEGSGLGLSIARSLTELQYGKFDLVIDGDLFTAQVTMPLVAQERAKAASKENPARPAENPPGDHPPSYPPGNPNVPPMGGFTPRGAE